jgi:hypothetical protein
MLAPGRFVKPTASSIHPRSLGRFHHRSQHADLCFLLFKYAAQLRDHVGVYVVPRLHREDGLYGLTTTVIVEIETTVDPLVRTFLLFATIPYSSTSPA